MVLSFPPSLAVLSPHIWSQYRFSLSLLLLRCCCWFRTVYRCESAMVYNRSSHTLLFGALEGWCSDLPCLWWANQGEQEETVTALWMQVNIILAANSHWAFYQLKPQTLFSLLSHVSFTLFLCCYVFRSKFRPSHLLLLLLLSSTIYWVPTIYRG